MLSLAAVSKTYAGTQVIKSLNLHVAAGRTTVLIGPSGCGKSTILRLITGLVTADAGSIAIHGVPLTPALVQPWRLRIGYVIQEGGLFPHLNVRQNICLMAGYLGWTRERIRDRLNVVADLFKLPAVLLDRHHYDLSGGQRQRVSLMRAMMLDPELLLLDEPLAALDPVSRFEMQLELREVFSVLRKTVLLVTHDMAEAGYFGDEIVLLKGGEILQQGSMADLVQRPSTAYVKQFVQAQRQPWRDIDGRLR
jgi:osmoprotectant transport system ATP-binding protein